MRHGMLRPFSSRTEIVMGTLGRSHFRRSFDNILSPPPCVSVIRISVLNRRFEMAARSFPSGDQRTFVRSKFPYVIGKASPPLAGISHKLCHSTPRYEL